jgi:hypothetical protein
MSVNMDDDEVRSTRRFPDLLEIPMLVSIIDDEPGAIDISFDKPCDRVMEPWKIDEPFAWTDFSCPKTQCFT